MRQILKTYGFYIPIVIFELCCYVFSSGLLRDSQTMDDVSFHHLIMAAGLLLFVMLMSIGITLVWSRWIPDIYMIRGLIILKITMAPIFILLWFVSLASVLLAFSMIFLPLSIFMIFTVLICSILLQIPGVIYSYLLCRRMRKNHVWGRKRSVFHGILLTCWIFDVIDTCYLGFKVWKQKKLVGGCLLLGLILFGATF